MDALREKLEACFIYLSYASPRIRRLANLSRLSQVWIEVPAWYLWLEEHPGAFMLECIGAGELGWEGGPCRVGNFSVRYFPPAGAAHVVVTKTECTLRKSRVFDETGTPVLDHLDLIRKRNYFAVGELSALFPSGGGVFFHLRENDGLTPAAGLLDALVRMYSYYLRTPPALWTEGEGWQAVSFPPAHHPHGGHAKQPLPLWQEMACVQPESEATSLCGCSHC